MAKTKPEKGADGKPDRLAQEACQKEFQIGVFDPAGDQPGDIAYKVGYRIEKENSQEGVGSHPAKDALIPGSFLILGRNDCARRESCRVAG